ncbi:hypothetical protein SLA2020_321600 [Shorea laevis]
MERVKRRLGFQHCFTVERTGRSGGLAVLWDKQVQLHLQSYSANHIDMEVAGVVQDKWRFTGFYGCPERHNRRKSWALIRELARQSSLPWLIGGDFNDLLSSNEKIGGAPQLEWMLRGFQEVINDCDLTEIPMVRGRFTWRRGRTEEKLDRCLVTTAWRNLFPATKVSLLPPLSSDHTPLWVTLNGKVHRMQRQRRKFIFENMWLCDNTCQEVIQSSWESVERSGDWSGLALKIQRCSNRLESWNRFHFGHVREKLRQCIKDIDSLRLQPRSEEVLAEEAKKANEMEEWLEREEVMWKQRSKEIWIHEGDRNTRFFHQRASRRRELNKIEGLMGENEEWHTKPE